jgi:hypothetical protein
MFEAYRIRPVLEWEGNDESRELSAFASLGKAIEAQTRLLRVDPNPNFAPRILWTLYGIIPEVDGKRTEEAIADRDSEAATLELLAKLIGNFRVEPDSTATGYFTPAPKEPPPTNDGNGRTVKVVLEFKIDLLMLRKQKRALIEITTGSEVSANQEEAAEGMLNMIDFIQDSILEQGLASEEDIFLRMPLLFAAA